MPRIGVLDDDETFVELLVALLRARGHETKAYSSAGRLLDALLRDAPDLLVLDVRLPGMDGMELVRLLRRSPAHAALPIIVVSGSETATERVVRGIESGADEYFGKPLDAELFLARIDSLLRRKPSAPLGRVLEAGALRVDCESRVASVGGRAVELRRLEFDLLCYLLTNANRIVTRPMLLESVWKEPGDADSRTVDKHVQNLRRKLGPGADWIETVVGLGYLFRPPKTAAGTGGRKPNATLT